MTEPKISPEDLAGGIRAYSLTDHIHEREASHHLSRVSPAPFKLAFIPHVAPWFQGIVSTVNIPLTKSLTAKQVKALYDEFYNEKLVQTNMQVPEIKVRSFVPFPISSPMTLCRSCLN